MAEKSETKSEESVEITFVIQPDGFRHGMVVSLNETMENVKNKVGSDLSLDPSVMTMAYNNTQVNDGQTLKDVGLTAGQEGVEIIVILPEDNSNNNELYLRLSVPLSVLLLIWTMKALSK